MERELSLLVYRQMRALAGPHPELCDLAQTALEQVLKSRFEGRAKWSTFTRSICYHVWLTHLRFSYRFRARFSFAIDGETHEQADWIHPEAKLEDRERIARLYEALERVSPKRRAVVALRDINGLEIREIAEIVDASEATVRTRLRDGRKKLRSLLQQDPYFSSHFSNRQEPT